MRNIFKIITLENQSKIEIKSFDKEDKRDLIAFITNQNLNEKIFFWMHKDPDVIIKEFEELINNGNNIIVAFCKGKVVGIGFSKKYEEYYFRHIDRFYLHIDKAFWGSGLTRELISELVYLSLEEGKERVIIELLPDMKEYKKELEALEFEQMAVLPNFFMDEKGIKRDIIIYTNHLGNLWKSFEENIDLQFRPHIMED